MIYDHIYVRTPCKSAENWIVKSVNEAEQRHLLHITSAGFGSWRPGCFYVRENSREFLVEYVEVGDAIVVVNGARHHVRAGEVYVLHKGTQHRYQTGPSGRLMKRHVNIEGPALDYVLTMANLSAVVHVRLPDPSGFRRLMKEIPQALSRRSADVAAQSSTLAYRVIDSLGQSIRPTLPPAVRSGVLHMHESLDRQLSVADLSSHVGMSESHFRRLFQAHMGESPIAYFSHRKLSWAARLLVHSSMTVTEIAARVGYRDPLYFSARFKKRYGDSPRAYRSRQRAEQ